MNEENGNIYEFGAFRLDPTARLLRREGKPVALTPKVFDTLLLLVQHHGELLEKEQLMKELWPDSFVEESNLTYNISTLRKALNEKAADNPYIVTVSGRGYRFVAEVREVSEQAEESISSVPAKPLPVQHKVKGKVAVAAGVLVLFSSILVYWAAHKPTATMEPPSPIKSIAVLPFQLVGAEKDSEAEYLSDGVTESLINRLSQLPGVKVIARSSSFHYKGKDIDPQEVARALGVEVIVTGRVLQRGEQLQISVELMDVRDKMQIWGEQYNRTSIDMLGVQAEISREIAEKLRLKLTVPEQQQLAKRETANPQAYEMILRGRFHREKGGTENLKKALEFFKRAVTIDPAYAAAYAELSIIYTLLSSFSILDPKEYLPQAEGAARKALELDDNLAEAHYALANVEMSNWNWAGAGQEFNRAFELNPNLARARFRHAIYLSAIGQHDLAVAEIERARELNPLSARFKANVASVLLQARRNDEAIEVLQNTLAMDHKSGEAHLGLGFAYAAKGMYTEAIAAYQEAIKLGHDTSSTQIYLGAAYAMAGQREKAQAILKQLQTSKEYVSPTELTTIYVALGEREQAFASLERAYTDHDLQLGSLASDPNFDPLRSDPRYQDLLRRVGLPQ